MFEDGNVDLCHLDPGHDIDVHLETDLRTITRVWMGWSDLDTALSDNSILVDGPKAHIATIRQWLGLSGLAHVPKKSPTSRVRPG